MGKPFDTELKKIHRTVEWAGSLDVGPIKEFFHQHAEGLIILVGAGGSFSAAELARLALDDKGVVAISHTPLSFLESKISLARAGVVIFTAGGNPQLPRRQLR